MQDISQAVRKIKQFREPVLKKRLSTPIFMSPLKDVRRILIINSSSRSGSSLLYALLRKLDGVYALSGEAAPFYKLNTALEICNLFQSDRISSSLLDTAVDGEGLTRDFFTDLHHARSGILTREIDLDEFADDLLLRLPLQWTDPDFDPVILRMCINTALERYAEQNAVFEADEFYLVLLEEIRKAYPGVNPFYYDINPGKVARHFPLLEVPSGPPNSRFNIEEPPFILLSPGRKATPADLEVNTLLLKSTVDCYRMNLIEKLFPEADIRIIHLTRNPASSTNGICDGWLHRGFFSHNLKPYFDGCSDLEGLRIRGYSDLYSFGRYWWNFDLPEGWQEVIEKDLVEVSAFQWYSANREIVQYLSRGNRKHLAVRYENIIRDPGSRTREFEAMLAFMDMPLDRLPQLELDDLPVVQATHQPQPYRWKKRPEILARLLGDPGIVGMADRLGYTKDNIEEWL
ncbi:MAG TPA: hypothetical protein VF905_09700 [Nitrospirota bacterium]